MDNPNEFQKSLLAWFMKNQRDLPWRKTYSPYHVWVSEIMLQQTQMDRGLLYFNRWIQRFPDLASLSRASEEEVLKLWEGLGYYSRARNILKSAKIIAHKSGSIPEDFEILIKLPGIGRYTAAAILSLAFNQNHAVVDANVERVFSRLFDISKPVKDKETQALIHKLAKKLLPSGQARNFNQALMELGALVCLPQNACCPACPIRKWCASEKRGIVDERPVPGKSNEILRLEMATGVLINNGRLFIQKRPEFGVWANLWEFPGGRLETGETPEQALIREFLEETEFTVNSIKPITTIRHSYTRYRISLHCFFCSLINDKAQPVLHEAQEFLWIRPNELQKYAFPAGHRKLIEFLTIREMLEL